MAVYRLCTAALSPLPPSITRLKKMPAMTQYERIAHLELSLTLRDKRLRRRRILSAVITMLATSAVVTISLLLP